MSSIFGQMAETGAGGGYGAGGGFGSALSSLGTSLGSFLTGGGFGTPGTSVANLTPTAYSVTPPASVSSGDPNAGAPTSYAGGTMAAPTPGDVLNPPSSVGYTPTGAPFSPANAPAPGPAAPSWWQSTFGAGGGGTPGTAPATATDPKGMGAPGWLALGGGLLEAVNRYMLQRQLQDPKALAQAASQIAAQQNAKVRAQLVAPVTAQMEESSGVNAPMIYGQALTNALAPGLWQAQQNALQEELAALSQSGALAGGGGGASGLDAILSALVSRGSL